MTQTGTPDLLDILLESVQVGADRHFAGRIEIDWVYPGYEVIGSVIDLNLAYGTVTGYTNGLGPAAPSNPNNVRDGSSSTESVSNNGLAFGDPAHPATSHRGWKIDLGAAYEIHTLTTHHPLGTHQPDFIEYSDDGSSWTPLTVGVDVTISDSVGLRTFTLTTFLTHRYWRMTDTEVFYYTGTFNSNYFESFGSDTIQVNGVTVIEVPAEIRTTQIPCSSIQVDRNRHGEAAQLDVVFSNETGTKGYYTEANPIFVPNNPIRAYCWYGDVANIVQVFAGLMDRPHESRNPKIQEVTARSYMKWLIEQLFRTTASQDASVSGNVRTEANGVFLNRSPEYIVAAILDMAGWPTAKRVLGTSGVTIAEYDLTDKDSYLQQIVGSDRLTGAANFDLWDDELGYIHFDVSSLTAGSEPDATYTWQAGVDVLQFDHETDDEERATRVTIEGPMTTTEPIWVETWETTRLLNPVGEMYRSSESAYLYVIDALKQYLYKLKQSDQSIVSKWNLNASLSYYPGGLSGDPSDSTIFWVLDVDWVHGGTTHAKVHKFDMSTKALISTWSLPDGDWSDMKSDGSNIWLTNYGDNKLYEYSTSGALVASYSYAGHTHPLGMYIDGTTIGLFFSGDQHFYKIDTSAPGTVTGTQSTKGTTIFGGEIDTTTHTDLYCSNENGYQGVSGGHVFKFALAQQVTTDVTETAIDYDLEDALGFQSGVQNRTHTGCPNIVGDHQFEIREEVISVKTVPSQSGALTLAENQLDVLKRLRRVMDLACLGNPLIQINDVIRYIDPVAGIDAKWVIDTYSSLMDAQGNYVTKSSVLPWET